jgi:hypothetical protein
MYSLCDINASGAAASESGQRIRMYRRGPNLSSMNLRWRYAFPL